MTRADPQRERLDALFAQALDLPADERTAFLDQACSADPGLRAELESLLRLAGEASGTLDAGVLAGGQLWKALAAELSEDTPPLVRIGPWRLGSELGRGGMGTVYLAHRAEGDFEQTAALKLLRTGTNSEEVLRRFEQERQIVARLNHPQVARLLDGGRTSDGRPYFVMEYVEGRPIDRYCDENRLSVDQRLGLLAKVGRAVEHAHRNLVVHRDLKPSNIVVTGEGEVKLLDFGIAKVIAPGGDGEEPLTRTVTRILTPEYASPEQVLGQSITVASDVYQLGLLLYELLTGQRAQRVEDPTPRSLQHAVCEGQPTRPSTLVATRAAAEAATARRTTPSALARKLRGDLDNIALMALRKEPERRYASAEQMVEDLERYRRGLPVRARPDTWGYRTGKFVRRHPWGIGAAAAFSLLLVGYAVTVTGQARQLARERDRASLEARKAGRVRDFLVRLFEAADPYQTKGESVTAAELVDAGARQAREELDAEPEVQAEMLGVLGTVLSGRASYQRAEKLLEEALALQRRLHPGDHSDLARAIRRYAAVLVEKGELARAEQLAREALEMRRRLAGPPDEEVADSLDGLAFALMIQGRHTEAEALYGEALAIRSRLPGSQEREIAELRNNLGVVLAKLGKLEESEAIHRQALADRRRLYPPDHPAVSESLNNLGVTLRRRGKPAEAEPLYREALEVRRRVLGGDHPGVANALNNLGDLHRRLGRLTESAASHREALAIRRRAFGPKHSNVALSLNNLGVTLRDAGRTREAERLLAEALAMFRATLPADHPNIGASALTLGRLLASTGRIEKAEPLLQEALAIRIAKSGEESAAADEARLALGLARAMQGRTDEARELIGTALRRLRAAGEGDRLLLAEAEGVLARLARRRVEP